MEAEGVVVVEVEVGVVDTVDDAVDAGVGTVEGAVVDKVDVVDEVVVDEVVVDKAVVDEVVDEVVAGEVVDETDAAVVEVNEEVDGTEVETEVAEEERSSRQIDNKLSTWRRRPLCNSPWCNLRLGRFLETSRVSLTESG